MKWKGLLASLALACGLAGGVYAATQVAGNKRAEIRAVPTAPDQIATVLNLQLHSFDVSLTPGKYNVHVWLEHWTRGAKEPQIQVFAIMGGVGGKDTLLTVLIPTTDHPESYVAWGGMSSRSTPTSPIDIKKINGVSIMEPRNVVIGDDLPLATFVSNKNGVVESGSGHVEQDNDDTYYLRARFSAGSDPGDADVHWKDGKALFN